MAIKDSPYKFATLVIIGISFLSACGEAKQKPAPIPPAVTVTEVSQQQIQRTATFVGRTEAIDDVRIRARVGGPLLKRQFKEGEDIAKGDLLFEIDPATYQTQVTQQKSALAKATSNVTIAKRNYARGRQLVESGTISATDMDTLTNKLDSALAELTQSEASLKESNLQLSYTQIHAPIDGRIGRSLFSIGDIVSPSSDTLVNIVKLQPLYVAFQINEKALSAAMTKFEDEVEALSPDDFIVELRLPDGGLYHEQGHLEFIDNRVDSSTGTIRIRSIFANANKSLLPGQYVNVIVREKLATAVTLIPQAAIQEDQQGRFVMVVDKGNKALRKNVTMGENYGYNWEVESGLELGDRVIVQGLQKIRQGAVVTATEELIKPFEDTTTH
jgi:membrane fusion protein (multidrug efflux system)